MEFKAFTLKSWEPNGLALKAFYEGDKNAAINIHQIDGSITSMPVEIFFRAENEIPELEEFALELCTGRVLDVGAGVGCHSIILKERGFQVNSLEIDSESVNIMKKRGLSSAFCKSFLKFESAQKFDTILFLMNGIGIAQKLNQLNVYLNHCKTLLKRNGQILLDSSNLEKTKTEKAYHGEIAYQLSYDNKFGEPYSWLYVDSQSLIHHAKQCDLSCQIIYEGDDGSYLARLFVEAI